MKHLFMTGILTSLFVSEMFFFVIAEESIPAQNNADETWDWTPQ
jgi:hypothetical protein